MPNWYIAASTWRPRLYYTRVAGEEIVVAEELGNRKRRIERLLRFKRLSLSRSLSITNQPFVYYFSRGGNTSIAYYALDKILRRWRIAAENPFCRVHMRDTNNAFKSVCCKRTTRIEIDAYGESARGPVDTIRSGTTTIDSRPGKFDPFAPSTIEK